MLEVNRAQQLLFSWPDGHKPPPASLTLASTFTPGASLPQLLGKPSSPETYRSAALTWPVFCQDSCHGQIPENRLEKHVVEFVGPLHENIPSYLKQELNQHIAAYINFMGLTKVVSLKDMMEHGSAIGLR